MSFNRVARPYQKTWIRERGGIFSPGSRVHRELFLRRSSTEKINRSPLGKNQGSGRKFPVATACRAGQPLVPQRAGFVSFLAGNKRDRRGTWSHRRSPAGVSACPRAWRSSHSGGHDGRRSTRNDSSRDASSRTAQQGCVFPLRARPIKPYKHHPHSFPGRILVVSSFVPPR